MYPEGPHRDKVRGGSRRPSVAHPCIYCGGAASVCQLEGEPESRIARRGHAIPFRDLSADRRAPRRSVGDGHRVALGVRHVDEPHRDHLRARRLVVEAMLGAAADLAVDIEAAGRWGWTTRPKPPAPQSPARIRILRE